MSPEAVGAICIVLMILVVFVDGVVMGNNDKGGGQDV